jgi:hypothetical protein
MFLDFLMNAGLRSTTSFFEKKQYWTWTKINGHCESIQLDYICTNQIRRFQNVAVSSSYRSDHLSIIGEIKLAARMSNKNKLKHQMSPPDWQALQDKDLCSKFNLTIFEGMIQDLSNFDSIEKSCDILKQASDILPRKSNAKKGWYTFDETNLKELAANWNHAKTEFEQVLSSKCDSEVKLQERRTNKLAKGPNSCSPNRQLIAQIAKKTRKANGKQPNNLSLDSPDITENQLILLT